MGKETYVKPYERKNKKKDGKHTVSGHTRKYHKGRKGGAKVVSDAPIKEEEKVAVYKDGQKYGEGYLEDGFVKGMELPNKFVEGGLMDAVSLFYTDDDVDRVSNMIDGSKWEVKKETNVEKPKFIDDAIDEHFYKFRKGYKEAQRKLEEEQDLEKKSISEMHSKDEIAKRYGHNKAVDELG